jgi:hypothetical protein
LHDLTHRHWVERGFGNELLEKLWEKMAREQALKGPLRPTKARHMLAWDRAMQGDLGPLREALAAMEKLTPSELERMDAGGVTLAQRRPELAANVLCAATWAEDEALAKSGARLMTPLGGDADVGTLSAVLQAAYHFGWTEQLKKLLPAFAQLAPKSPAAKYYTSLAEAYRGGEKRARDFVAAAKAGTKYGAHLEVDALLEAARAAVATSEERKVGTWLDRCEQLIRERKMRIFEKSLRKLRG